MSTIIHSSMDCTISIVKHSLDDGGMVLSASRSLSPHPSRMGDWLLHRAETQSDNIFLGDRHRLTSGNYWRTVTFVQALGAVRSIGQWLIGRGINKGATVLILSENRIEAALVTFAAMHVGVIVCPVSTGLSLYASDFARLRSIVDVVMPKAIFVDDLTAHWIALDSVVNDAVPIVQFGAGEGAIVFDDILRTEATSEVDRAFGETGPDTVAKYLFTSGSTGSPKGVTTTQRMLCSNQQAMLEIWPVLSVEPAILVDWSPWSHTHGGNLCLGLPLSTGGSFYIDDGRPTAVAISDSIENLKTVSPTIYFGIPIALDLLSQAMESDENLRNSFFARMNLLLYAGASLPDVVRQRLSRQSKLARGKRLPIHTGWGTTETAPVSTMTYLREPVTGNIGVPLPGTSIRLAPVEGRFEIRVKGPNVTSGYLNQPELTQSCFDERGYFRTGDAGTLRDESRPELGIQFLGRIAENFKLQTSTWVLAGGLRLDLLNALGSLVSDLVVAGDDRSDIRVFVFPDPGVCAAKYNSSLKYSEWADYKPFRDDIRALLVEFNKINKGSSRRVAAALIMRDAPSHQDGELTAKGTINRSIAIAKRKESLALLYDGTSPEAVTET